MEYFIEINRDNAIPISPEQQEEGIALSTIIRPVTEDEYKIYHNHYRMYKQCLHHLIEDVPFGDYYQRHCVICNKYLGLI